ncbi:MAG: filamentous hemagglutinin-related protein, partial [Proteobacteria bacterium]|nr:filamentous hemagglutinin-related protein [Pseudomonadota bacterium]
MLNLASTVAPQATGLAPGDAIPLPLNGNTRVSAQAIEAAGFDRVNLTNETGVIRLENGLDIGAGRALPLRELVLNTPRVETAGGDAALTADAIRLANDGMYTSTAPAAPAPSGTLTVNARQIELAGRLALEGMAQAELNGSEAITLAGGFPESRVDGQRTLDVRPVGELKTSANLVFRSRVVSPATYVQYSVLAPGKTVQFKLGSGSPTQPWSAFGSLKVEAMDIVQGGTIWVPQGKIELRADNALVLENGSLTSVAAEPNSVLPFGKLLNGRTWTYDLNAPETDAIEIAGVPEQKSILTQAATINMQAGARLDLSGGGDAQAYEFSVGPGGSRDILADKNTYAILPGYTGGFAPTDAQETFDRASGEAVYLSGMPGLADGMYTLLPAHYALLPGAYAVKLDTGIANVMPGQAYSRQDGVRVAAGYVTDSRTGAPRDANWQGVQVMTRDQVRARSEFTLTRATDFYADGRMRPQDAGLLSIATTGSGADALKLDAVYNMKAGSGGRGAQVDISALKIAVTSGSPTGIDPDAVVLDTDTLNALGADSLFIGGTRSTQGDTTTLTVGANEVKLANDAAHALKADEIMLAAKDTLTLKAGSALDAQGAAGDAGTYETDGNGAFVRAASTTAMFARSGSPDRSAGTLVGEVGSSIAAADSIAHDATKENAFKGATRFEQEKTVNGVVERNSVNGNLAVGANRINFGEAPGSAEGITYSQAELNAFNSLNNLTLTSYTTFDLYTGRTEMVNGVVTASGVKIGGLDGDDKPTLQNLTLQGAGLAGIDNAGQTAQLNAKNLTLANPAAASFSLPKDAAGNEVALGSGTLAVTADTLTLGAGDKAIKGFDTVTVTANELVAAAGTGELDIVASGVEAAPGVAPVTLNVARISGERGSDQTLLASAGKLTVAQRTADRTLMPVTALGAKWAMQGSSVDFNSHAELASGTFKLTATAGDVNLGADAKVDVAGREVQFFDVTKPSWGGTAEFVSDSGNVDFAAGSNVNVSAAAGGDAGSLIVRAANGAVSLADGSVSGTAAVDANGQRGEGARADIVTGTLTSFSTLNTALNSGGFDGTRRLRVRNGDVSIAATDEVKAHTIAIAADNGKLNVEGTLDASGEEAGRIELFATNNVDVKSTAKLTATSSGANEDGGDIVIGTREGNLNLAASNPGKGIDVSGGAGGQGGSVLLRAPHISGDTDVAVSALDSTISGARSVTIEAVKVYEYAGDTSLTSADLDTIKTDNDSFATHQAAIKSNLGKSADPLFHIVSGVEVHATGDLTLANDWNLSTARAGGEAGVLGVLTLAADGNLNINGNLSDGFVQATPMKSGSNPAELLADNSWSYRLVAGADAAAADPLAIKTSAVSMTLAANKLIRTGTGDIQVASGGDIVLGNDKSVIYTAGRRADSL